MPFQLDTYDPGMLLARLRPTPPNFEDLEQKQLAIQNLRNEASLFPLKKQEAELALKGAQYNEQERQYGLQERQAWQDAMTKYGGDYEKARPELAAKLRPTTLGSIDKVFTDHQDKLADIGKKRADAAKIHGELENDEREAFGGIAMDVANSNYNPAVFDSALSMLQVTHPEYKDHINALRQQVGDDPDMIRQGIDRMITPKARAAAQELATKKAQQLQEEQQTKLTEAQVPGAKAKSDIEVAQAKALTGMSDTDWQSYIDGVVEDHNSPLYRRTVQMVDFYRKRGNLKAADDAVKNAGEQLGKTESAVATAKATAPIKIDVSEAEWRARNTIPGLSGQPLTGDAANLHGEDYLRTLPGSVAARLRRIAAGDEVAPTGRAAMTGIGAQLMDALYQYDPEYTPLLAQQRKETLKEFTNTTVQHAGGQLLALNTLVHHAELYRQVAESLKNGTWRPGNAIYNRVAQIFGAAPPVEADLVARFLAGETGKVATGGVPGEGEVNGILASLKSDSSPEQIDRVGSTIMQIAAGRMVPLQERRDKAKLQNFVDILGPDAREILQRRGYDPATMKPVGAGGGGQQQLVIEVGGKHYRYNGTGAKKDLKNYTEIPNAGGR